MRDPERINRILEKLEELWKKYPQQRLGQVLENYVFTGGERGDKTSVELFFQADTETEDRLDELIEEISE